jgi:opacity protein-like surface antigen
MKKFHIFFAIAATFLASSTANASSTATPILSNEEYRVGAGDIETTFSINPEFISSSVGDDERITMRLGGNYFLNDIFAPGFEFSLDAGMGTSIRVLPNIKVYWPLDQRLMPYIQAGFGYAREVGSDFAAFSIGPGVNYMLSNSVALGVQLRYDLGAGSQTLHEIQLPVQFAIYFKY